MLKLIKKQIYSGIFSAFIIFFAHVAESNANVIKAQFQDGVVITVSEKDKVMGAVNTAVIHAVEEQDGLALEKVEKVAFREYAGVWGGIGIISILVGLLTNNLPGILVSLVGLLI
ncbi:hypothetical protein [Bartonella sp. CB178]|uniref:hypothetical protein n=1 Tax=Bartonella sp. CB178 TaxID=3112255 RepID=UPI00300E1B11